MFFNNECICGKQGCTCDLTIENLIADKKYLDSTLSKTINAKMFYNDIKSGIDISQETKNNFNDLFIRIGFMN